MTAFFRCLAAGGWLAALGSSLGLLACASHHATGEATLVITHGGTYSGTYTSAASDVACVRVATREPVVLDGCQLRGPGNLIEAAEGTDLTVRNCRGQGLPPTRDRQAPGRFLDAYKARRLTIEHNQLAQTSGIVVNRWTPAESPARPGAPVPTLTVRYNVATNIDGRWREGTASGGEGFTRSSFLQLNTVQHLPGVEIAFNQVVNQPERSRVEDNFNFFNSSGTAASPLRVHDNFVRGGYPIPATAKDSFTGSGLTTDGDATTPETTTAYLEADHNQFIGIGNAGMNIAGGHDIYYHDNRLISSGLLPDGRQFFAGFAGLGVANYYKQASTLFFNHRVENNTVGYVRWGGHEPAANRQDLSPGACAPCAATTIHLPGPITLATENLEWLSWLAKVRQHRVVLGPLGPAARPARP